MQILLQDGWTMAISRNVHITDFCLTTILRSRSVNFFGDPELKFLKSYYSLVGEWIRPEGLLVVSYCPA